MMKQQLKLLVVLLLLNSGVLLATNDDVSTRVVGGDDANDGDWPWIVAVSAGGYFCGGALISESTVLTAAHCLHDANNNEIPAAQISVVVGEFDLSSISSRFEISISRTQIHSGYNPVTDVSSNDLALLYLNTPVTDITPLDRVSLSLTEEAIAIEDEVTLLGWGSTVGYAYDVSVIPVYPDILQVATLPLKHDSYCKQAYKSNYDSTAMLCAGKEEGGVDACQGDSGGPLIYNNGGSWQQIGIVSFGSGCANAGSPGVYTRVAEYNGWIDNFLNSVSADSELSFIKAEIDTTETQQLLISNNAESAIALTLSLTGDAEFSYDDSNCKTIAVDSSCSLAITYSPTSFITNEATLTIDSDLQNSMQISTTLSGTPYLKGSSSGGGSILFVLTLPLLLLRRAVA